MSNLAVDALTGLRLTLSNPSRAYYLIRPFLPRTVQILLRRRLVKIKRSTQRHIWPVDPASATPPASWDGWPEKKKFALILTHDVDTGKGLNKCMDLARLEMNLGFRSNFNFVPERYDVSFSLIDEIRNNGFEIGVHGLKHDGKLYTTQNIFNERAERINYFLKLWKCVGFRSPAMHHNLEWLHKLDIAYDMSTFDTDPFEPQNDGMGTIFPFWVESHEKQGYVELPYTLPQDFTLFILMGERNITIWKNKLDWVAENGGMALLNVHPDYMNFEKRKSKLEEYSAKLYSDFLEYVIKKYDGEFWSVLPKELAQFWKENMVNK